MIGDRRRMNPAHRAGRRSMLFLLFTLVPVFFFACSHSDPAAKAGAMKSLKDCNLVIVVLDSLRADHMGCYGYWRDTTPFMDSLAAEGLVFEEARSNTSFTQESVCVILSGQLPSHSGSIGWGAAPSPKQANLGELYRKGGYKTGFFTNSAVFVDPRYAQGFDETGHMAERWDTSGTGPRLSERALEFARKCGDEKFMMYVHYLDPHAPWEPQPGMYERFADKRFPDPVNLYTEVRPRRNELVADGFGPGDPRFNDMLIRYDAEIAHSDLAVEKLCRGLKEAGKLDNTLIVITSDHGEEFLEHGWVEHAWTLFEESLRIPLILWAPGRLKAVRIDTPVSLVDMAPTLLALMEVPHSRNDFDATPLFHQEGESFLFTPPEGPFIAELLIRHRCVLRTVMQGDYKYMAAQQWLTPEERPKVLSHDPEVGGPDPVWAPTVHEALYYLSRDPKEMRNLADQFEREKKALRGVLDRYHEKCIRSGSQDTSSPLDLPPEEIERLKALGYM